MEYLQAGFATQIFLSRSQSLITFEKQGDVRSNRGPYVPCLTMPPVPPICVWRLGICSFFKLNVYDVSTYYSTVFASMVIQNGFVAALAVGATLSD